jgi:hypothetical protein
MWPAGAPIAGECIGGCVSKDEFTYWLELPEGTKHVLFGDLQHLIANAVWPHSEEYDPKRDLAYAAACVNLEDELPRAVTEGRLTVRDPLTLGPHTFPIGEALQRAVVLLPDLRQFLAPRGIGIRLDPLCPVETVAQEVAAQRFPLPTEGSSDALKVAKAWRGWTTSTLLTQLNGYVYDGKLGVYVEGKYVCGSSKAFSTPQTEWKVDAANRPRLSQLFKADQAMVRPVFDVPPRPTVVPPLLKLLPGDTPIWVRQQWRWNSEMTSTPADAIDIFDEMMRRQSEGWFTVCEAAKVLADSREGISARDMVERLRTATVEGKPLPRNPGDRLPISDPQDFRDFSSLVLVSDINKWLASHQAGYSFPKTQDMPGPFEAFAANTQGDELRRIGGQRLWRISDAVEYVTSMPGFGVSKHDLEARLSSHEESALLTVRSVSSGKPSTASNLSVFIDEWLYAEDFNGWLEVAGFLEPYRLPVEALAAIEQDQQSDQDEASGATVRLAGPTTWWSIASAYMVEKLKAGQYTTAKSLYHALEAEAGSDTSPFAKGVGANRGSLFVKEINQTLSLKTVQNNWPQLKDAARSVG